MDSQMVEMESESEVVQILPLPPPPPRTVRTLDDLEIPDSEISEFSFNCKTKYFTFCGRIFHNDDTADEEDYRRHHRSYRYQFDRTDGFDINWEDFDYLYVCHPADWLRGPLIPGKSNDDLIRELTLYAIDEHNKESGENLEFVEHVKANFLAAAGWVFFITFRARDASSPNAEPKLYQTKARSFGGIFDVEIFRPKPTDEEMAPAQADPPRD